MPNVREHILIAPAYVKGAYATELPESNDRQERYVALECSCGRTIWRAMGRDDFSCEACGRSFVWGRASGGEAYLRQ